MGGTPAAGTYYTTAVNVFGPCVGSGSPSTGQHSSTVVVMPSSTTTGIVNISSQGAGDAGSDVQSSSYSTSGTAINLQTICGSNEASDADQYTATATEIDIFSQTTVEGADGGSCSATIVSILTKQ
jgi:hypothetical protein